MAEVKNLSRLTNLYFDSGRDSEVVDGTGDGNGSPGFVLSPTWSFGYDTISQEPWISPFTAEGYGQLQGTNDGYLGSAVAPGEAFWTSPSPTMERAASLNLSDENEEPKKRYPPL